MSPLESELALLAEAMRTLEDGPARGDAADDGAWRTALLDAAERMRDNLPYGHPLYIGQMLKPPHPVARLAYALAMFINPNNHALDGGRASSAMEKEAVAEIARIFGWNEFLGHLCSGGTVANLEALWVAGQLQKGKKIVASSQAHYTHGRISGVLQLPFAAVECDALGRMDLNDLETKLKHVEGNTYEMVINETSGVPRYFGGIMLQSLRVAGAKDSSVDIVHQEGNASTYRIQWS